MAEKMKMNANVWLILIFAWISIAASQVITFGYGMMMPGIMQELGLNTGQMGLIGGIASWLVVITLIPNSMLFSRFNPKYSVPIVIIGTALGLFLFGRATGLPMLYVSRLIAAVFSQLIATLLVGAKLRGVPPDSMTQINGIENFVQPIGQIIATLVMAQLLVLVGGWRGVYTLVPAIMTVAAVVYIVLWGNGKNVNYGQAEAGPAETAQTISKPGVSPIKEALTNKVVWLTSLAWPGTTIVWIAMFYFWPTYVTQTHGLELRTAGLVLSMIPIFSAIASLTSPMIARKIGYDKPLICSWGIILPVLYFLMTVVTNVPLLCLFAALAGYGAYCFVPLAFTNVYKIGLSRQAITIATGVILTFVAVGSAVAGTVVGALTMTFGLKNALAISCLTPIWFGVLTLFLPELGYKKMAALKAAAAAAQKAAE
jgi:sugar phosphate permease